ncbi:MAG: thioredoxin-like domain-containing protein [Acidimicrobiales bacterium]
MPARVPAPELDGRGGWLGVTKPLSVARLKGKAVLVYFWSASSAECQRLIDDLRPIEDLFADELVVVGVHAPRFPAESDHATVAAAVASLAIAHPVVDDSDLSVWEAYGAGQWPTVVLVTPTGDIAGMVAGDDCGAVLEEAVTEVLEGAAVTGRVRRRPVVMDRLLLPGGPLAFPGKVAASPDGRLLAVADTANDRVLVCSPDGVVLEAHTGFLRPQGVRFDLSGVVVCDTLADRVVRTDGEVLADAVVSPWDLVSDGRSWVIAEAGGHHLLRVRPGELRTRLVAGTGAEGSADGPVEKAELAQPSGVACTAGGVVFVDAGGSALRRVVEDRRGGVVSTLVGDGLLSCGDADGPGDVARLQFPLGVAADPRIADGPVYVADTYNDAIRVWEDGRLRTLPTRGLRRPGGIDVLGDGRLVVADTGNHRIVVVDPATGTVTPIDMDETWVHGTDGPPVRLSPGRPFTLDVGIELVDETLDRDAGAPVEVVVSSRPAGLLAAGPVRVSLADARGAVGVTGGHAGFGHLLVQITAATLGAMGATKRVQRFRHPLDVAP